MQSYKNESQHTKEPWHAPGLGEIHAENHDEIAQILFHNEDDDGYCGTEHDARRIVTCVNYCKGISNERMESDMDQGVNAKDQIDAYDLLRQELIAAQSRHAAEREALVNALKYIVAHCTNPKTMQQVAREALALLSDSAQDSK